VIPVAKYAWYFGHQVSQLNRLHGGVVGYSDIHTSANGRSEAVLADAEKRIRQIGVV